MNVAANGSSGSPEVPPLVARAGPGAAVPGAPIEWHIVGVFGDVSTVERFGESGAPQIYVPPTFAAYRQNRDQALEAILSYRSTT